MIFRFKRNYLLLIAFSIFVLFSISAIIQKNNKIQASQKHIDDLASISINNAWNGFSEYLKVPSKKNYLMGINSFYAFYLLYPETSCYDTYYQVVITDTYDTLLFDDSVDTADIQRLVDALEFLANNFSDIRGYSALRKFKNGLLA